jgi:hypothetical protein
MMENPDTKQYHRTNFLAGAINEYLESWEVCCGETRPHSVGFQLGVLDVRDVAADKSGAWSPS